MNHHTMCDHYNSEVNAEGVGIERQKRNGPGEWPPGPRITFAKGQTIGLNTFIPAAAVPRPLVGKSVPKLPWFPINPM